MKRLYTDGMILTMETDAPAEALLCEDGRILAAGSRAALAEQARGAQRVSLDGATLMPGFIDAHSHFSQVASGMLQVSLEGAASADEIKRRISRFIEEQNPAPGSWILAKDYDPSLLPGGANPPLSAIDAFAPGRPLMIQHQSGHMGLFNSEALMRLGVTAATLAPEGGRIGKADGALTGYMEENAFFTYTKMVPTAEPEQLIKAYRSAQRLYASYGITTVQEGYFVKEMLPLYQLLLARELLQLDLVAYPDPETFLPFKAAFPAPAGAYQSHIKLGGMKLFLDGSPQGRTAWMRTPYLGGAPDDCGYGTMQDADVTAAFSLAAKYGAQVLTHCNGDAAVEQLLRCLAHAEADFSILRTLRPVIIHAQLLDMDQIPRAAALHMIASFFIAHVWYFGDIHVQNFGIERASRISPAASALIAGLPFTFHQDAPVIRPDMLETVWCAVNRLTKSGVLLGAGERIPVFEALKAVTCSAAYQYFEEDSKGTLAPGKREDLVILDKNPLLVPPEEIRSIRVLQTVKDGNTVFSR